MADLPSPLARSRRRAEARARTPADGTLVAALRHALEQLHREQLPLLAKVIADGRAGDEERSALDDALGRLARYYGVAVSYDPGDTDGAGHLRTLRRMLEEQALALVTAMEDDVQRARHAWSAARARLDALASASLAGLDPETTRRIHETAEQVWDPATGRSRYDADGDAWVTFELRCPRDGCGQIRPYRLLARHPTHRFQCSECGATFTLFVGTGGPATREPRPGWLSHRVVARGADGGVHTLAFEEASTDGTGLLTEDGDLLLFTYDDAGRLRLVRNYTRRQEAVVATGRPCFVATAARGPLSPEVRALRRFRDHVLLPRRAGRLVVAAYDVLGPPLAVFVARNPGRRAAAGLLVRALARAVA